MRVYCVHFSDQTTKVAKLSRTRQIIAKFHLKRLSHEIFCSGFFHLTAPPPPIKQLLKPFGIKKKILLSYSSFKMTPQCPGHWESQNK